MKVRNGFVSNSSSCSFTIELTEPVTIGKLLKDNLHCFGDDKSGYDFDFLNTLQSQLHDMGWESDKTSFKIYGDTSDSETSQTTWFLKDELPDDFKYITSITFERD